MERRLTIPKWLKRKKQRVCRKCGGPPLSDIFRKRATFWCSACQSLWYVRRVPGGIKVHYVRGETNEG